MRGEVLGSKAAEKGLVLSGVDCQGFMRCGCSRREGRRGGKEGGSGGTWVAGPGGESVSLSHHRAASIPPGPAPQLCFWVSFR